MVKNYTVGTKEIHKLNLEETHKEDTLTEGFLHKQVTSSQNLKIPYDTFCLNRVAQNNLATDAKWNSEMLVNVVK